VSAVAAPFVLVVEDEPRLAKLVADYLRAAGMEVAEVVHEALIRRWGQLQSWIEADRGFRTW